MQDERALEAGKGHSCEYATLLIAARIENEHLQNELVRTINGLESTTAKYEGLRKRADQAKQMLEAQRQLKKHYLQERDDAIRRVQGLEKQNAETSLRA